MAPIYSSMGPREVDSLILEVIQAVFDDGVGACGHQLHAVGVILQG